MKEFFVAAWIETYRYDAGKLADYSFSVCAKNEAESKEKGMEKIRSYYGYKGKISMLETCLAVSLII